MNLYAIREYRKGHEVKNEWRKIGAAWAHEDGKGFSIKLDLVPLNLAEFSIVMREPLPEKQEGGEEIRF